MKRNRFFSAFLLLVAMLSGCAQNDGMYQGNAPSGYRSHGSGSSSY